MANSAAADVVGDVDFYPGDAPYYYYDNGKEMTKTDWTPMTVVQNGRDFTLMMVPWGISEGDPYFLDDFEVYEFMAAEARIAGDDVLNSDVSQKRYTVELKDEILGYTAPVTGPFGWTVLGGAPAGVTIDENGTISIDWSVAKNSVVNLRAVIPAGLVGNEKEIQLFKSVTLQKDANNGAWAQAVSLKNGAGENLFETGLQGSAFTAEVKFTNQTDAEKNVTAMMALYKDNQLVDLAIEKFEHIAGKTQDQKSITLNAQVPSDSSGYQMKRFVWYLDQAMVPISEPILQIN